MSKIPKLLQFRTSNNLYQSFLNIIQRFLGISLLSALITMCFYIFLKKFFPYTPHLKDLLLLMIALLALISVTINKEQKWNKLDFSVLFLTLFLFGELIRTAILFDSFLAAYYEFRISFLSIVVFLAFRVLQRRDLIIKRGIQVLWLACFLTILESCLLNANLISSTFVGRIASVPDNVFNLDLGGILKRVVGIAGTSHITGIVNLALFAFIAPQVIAGEKSKRNLGLLGLAVLAVFLSTSRTAWSGFLFLIALILIKWFYQKRILAIAILSFILCLPMALELSYSLRTLPMLESYFTFLDIYKGLFIDLVEPGLKANVFFGLGLDVGSSAPINLWNITAQSSGITDIMIGQIIRYFGLIGLLLFGLTLFALPLQVFFESSSPKLQGSALATIGIFTGFSHYSPLTQPVAAFMLWMLLALTSDHFDAQISKSR